MDVYLHENSKTYRACEIQNNAQKSSLERKTLGLELERRKTSLLLSREEHHLREQLKQIQITKAKNELEHYARDAKPVKPSSPVEIVKKLPTEPYPITFPCNTPSPTEHGKHMDKYGKRYGVSRRRLPSNEFEDVHLRTNPLLTHEESSGYRRRVNSMSISQKRPSLRRHILHGRTGNGEEFSNSSSRESLNTGSITSLDNAS